MSETVEFLRLVATDAAMFFVQDVKLQSFYYSAFPSDNFKLFKDIPAGYPKVRDIVGYSKYVCLLTSKNQVQIFDRKKLNKPIKLVLPEPKVLTLGVWYHTNSFVLAGENGYKLYVNTKQDMKEFTPQQTTMKDIADYQCSTNGDVEQSMFCENQIIGKIGNDEWLLIGVNRKHFYISKRHSQNNFQQWQVNLNGLRCRSIKQIVAHPMFYGSDCNYVFVMD